MKTLQGRIREKTLGPSDETLFLSNLDAPKIWKDHTNYSAEWENAYALAVKWDGRAINGHALSKYGLLDTAVGILGATCGKKLNWILMRRLHPSDWEGFKSGVMSLEEDSFGAGNVFDESRMRSIFTDRDGISLVLAGGNLNGFPKVRQNLEKPLGICYGGPIEKPHFSDLEEVKNDPHYGQNNTFYGAGIALEPNIEGRNLSLLMAMEFLKIVINAKPLNDGQRYRYLSMRAEKDSVTTKVLSRMGAQIKVIQGGYSKTGSDMAYITLDIDKYLEKMQEQVHKLEKH
jgi:hypothetical protein